MKTPREKALRVVTDWYGIQTHGGGTTPPTGFIELLTLARQVGDFLQGPVALTLRVGLVRNQATGAWSRNQPEGTRMQLHDDEQVTYTLAGKDAKGYDVPGEAFTAASSDESAATTSQDGDTFTVVAGAPGSAVITFTESNSGLFVTQSIDVIAGDITKIDVIAGEVTKQTPPAAPTADTPTADAPTADAPPADVPVDTSLPQTPTP